MPDDKITIEVGLILNVDDIDRQLQQFNPVLNLGGKNVDTSQLNKTIQEEVNKTLAKNKNIPLSFDADTEGLKQASKSVEQLKKEVADLKPTKVQLIDTGNIIKQVYEFNTAMGETIKMTNAYSKITGELVSTNKSEVWDVKPLLKYANKIDEINKLQDDLTSKKKMLKDLRLENVGVNDTIEQVSRLKVAITELNNLYESAKDSANSEQLNEIDNKLKEITTTYRELNRTINSDVKLFNDGDKISEQLSKQKTLVLDLINTKSHLFEQEDIAKIKNIENRLNGLNGTLKEQQETLRETGSELSGFKNKAREAEAGLSPLKKAFMEFKKFSIKSLTLSAMYKAVNMVTSGLREATRAVVEMDTAMVDLKKVTDESESTYKNFMSTATSIGKEVGRTGTEVIKATSEFARMGFSLKESSQLAKEALTMVNVGDNIKDLEDASKSIIATLKAFGISGEESVAYARKINDAFNEVSNNFAINTGDLAEGVRRSAAVLKASGNDFNEIIGMLTGGNEIVQNISRMSTGLNTISQRIRGIAEDSKTGDLEPKLAGALSRAGVQILDLEGNLRSTYDILNDLAQVYDTLDDKTRQFLMSQMAGLRGTPYLEALLSNWESVAKATETANNSAGSAMIEQMKYLDSINGKVAQLKANLISMVTGAGVGTAMKGVLDGLIGITNALDNLLNLDKLGLKKIQKANAEMEKTDNILNAVGNSINKLKSFDAVTPTNVDDIRETYNVLKELMPSSLAIIDNQNYSYQEQVEKLDELYQREVKLQEVKRQYQQDSYADKIEKETESLEKLAETRLAIQKDLEEALDKQQRLSDTGMYSDLLEEEIRKLESNANKHNKKISTSIAEIEEMGGSISDELINKLYGITNEISEIADDTKKKLQELFIALDEGDISAVYGIMEMVKAGAVSLDEAMQGLSNAFTSGKFSSEELEQLTETFPELAKALDPVIFENLANSFSKMSSELKGLNGVIEEYAKNEELSLDTVSMLLTKYPEMIQHITKVGDSYKLTEGFLDAVSQKEDEYRKKIDETVASSQEMANVTDETNLVLGDRVFQTQDFIEKQREYLDLLNSDSAKQDENNDKLRESAEAHLQAMSSINELNTSLSEGTISASEYANEISKAISSLDFSGMSSEALENVVTNLEVNLTSLMSVLNEEFASGNIGLTEFQQGMTDVSQTVLDLHNKLSSVSSITGVFSGMSSDIDNVGNSLDKAIKNFSGFKDLMKTFEEFGDVIAEGMTTGVAKFTDEMMKSDGFKQFQVEFQKQIVMLKDKAPKAWDEYVTVVSQSLGVSKTEAEDSINDINSSLYTSNENFNTAVSTAIDVLNTGFSTVVDNVATLVGDLIDTIGSVKITLDPKITNKTIKILGKSIDIPSITIEPSVGMTKRYSPPKSLSNISQSHTGGLSETLASAMGFGNLNVSQGVNGFNFGYEANKNFNTAGQKIADSIREFGGTFQNSLGGFFSKLATQQPTLVNSNIADPSALREKTGNKSSKDSGGGGSKSAQADRYAGINAELEQNNTLLKENDELLVQNKNNVNAIMPLLSQRQTLESRQQDILHRLNEARRTERAELEKSLSSRGFRFEGTGDNKIISNIGDVTVKTKEAQEELDRYIKLSGEIKQTSAEWLALGKSVDTAVLSYEGLNKALEENASLNDINNAILESYGDNIEAQIPYLKNRATLLRQQFSLIQDSMYLAESERQSMEQILSGLGYTFAGEGLTRHISNLKNVGTTTEFAKEMVSAYIDKSKEIAGLSSQWNEVEKAITGATNAIQLQLRELELFSDNINHQLDIVSSKMSLFQSRMNRAEKNMSSADGFNFEPYYQASRDYAQAMLDQNALLQQQQNIQNQQMMKALNDRRRVEEELRHLGGQFDANGNLLNGIEMSASNVNAEFQQLRNLHIDLIQKARELEMTYNRSAISLEENVNILAEMEEKAKELYLAKQKEAFAAQEQAKQEELRLKLSIEQDKLAKAQEEERKRVEALNTQLQEYRDNLSAIHTVQEYLVAIIRKRGELEKKALDETHQKELDQAKEKLDAKVKGYNDELDAFKKMINDKLKALDEQNKEEDFLDNLRKEEEQARELKRQIYILSLDDSLQARRKRSELETKLKDQEEKIDKLKKNKKRDEEKDALKKQLQDYEKDSKEKEDLDKKYYDEYIKSIQERQKLEKEALDKEYENAKVYTEARIALQEGMIKSFDGQIKSLEVAYMEFQERFGSGMGALRDKIEFEFLGALEKAQQGLVQLGTVGIEEMMRPNYEVRKLTGYFDELTAAIKASESAIKNFQGSLAGFKSPLEGLGSQINPGEMPNSFRNPYGMTNDDLAQYTANKMLYTTFQNSPENKWLLDMLAQKNANIRRKYNMGADNHTYEQWLQTIDNMGGSNNNLGMKNSDYIRMAGNKYAYTDALNQGYGFQWLYNYLNNQNNQIRSAYGLGVDSFNYEQFIRQGIENDNRIPWDNGNNFGGIIPSGVSPDWTKKYNIPTNNQTINLPKPDARQSKINNMVSNMKSQEGLPYSQGANRTTTHRDCSSAIGMMLWSSGLISEEEGKSLYTGNMADILLANGFEDMGYVPFDKLKEGDILMHRKNGSGHTEMALGNGKTYGAHKPGTPLGEGKYTGYQRVFRLSDKYGSTGQSDIKLSGDVGMPKLPNPPSVPTGNSNVSTSVGNISQGGGKVNLSGNLGQTRNITINLNTVDVQQAINEFSRFSEVEKQVYLNNKKVATELLAQGKKDTEEYARVARENQELRNKYSIEADKFNYEQMKNLFDNMANNTSLTTEYINTSLGESNEQLNAMIGSNTSMMQNALTQMGGSYADMVSQGTNMMMNASQQISNNFTIISNNLSARTQAFASQLQAEMQRVRQQDMMTGNNVWRPDYVDLDRLERNFQTTNASDELREEAYRRIMIAVGGNYGGINLTPAIENPYPNSTPPSIFTEEYLRKLRGYSEGGKVTHTGLAMVHGSSNAPEWIFNNEQFNELAKLVASYEPQVARVKTPKGEIANKVDVTVDRLINVEGNVTEDVMPEIKAVGRDIITDLGRQLEKKGIKRRL